MYVMLPKAGWFMHLLPYKAPFLTPFLCIFLSFLKRYKTCQEEYKVQICQSKIQVIIQNLKCLDCLWKIQSQGEPRRLVSNSSGIDQINQSWSNSEMQIFLHPVPPVEGIQPVPSVHVCVCVRIVVCQQGGVSNKPPWLQWTPGSNETRARDQNIFFWECTDLKFDDTLQSEYWPRGHGVEGCDNAQAFSFSVKMDYQWKSHKVIKISLLMGLNLVWWPVTLKNYGI